MKNFIKELANYLENNLDKSKEEKPIVEEILSKNKVTTANENSIKWNVDEVILKYAEQNFSQDILCFVKDNKKTYWSNNKQHYDNDTYSVLKVENNEIKEIGIKKEDMPKGIGINDVFKIENDKYIIDKSATQELQEEITEMAKEIIDKQNGKLEKYRQEGHLYVVREELGTNRFLWDLTDMPKFEFEEVNIPEDVLDKATQGAVLKYTNGTYEYFSNDGFEREEKIGLSK